MKLSTKARYGLKAALILTKANGNIVPLSVMSKEIGVSSAYIERLMKLMKDSSIVDSARGITGPNPIFRQIAQFRIFQQNMIHYKFESK